MSRTGATAIEQRARQERLAKALKEQMQSALSGRNRERRCNNPDPTT
jgi:hypothetical protein